MKNRELMEEMTVKLFGSTSRPRILSLLLGHPQQTPYQREIMCETGLSLQTVQRELESLSRLGILKKRETKGRIITRPIPPRHGLDHWKRFANWPEKGKHFRNVSYKTPLLFWIFSKRIELKLLTEKFGQELGLDNLEIFQEFNGTNRWIHI